MNKYFSPPLKFTEVFCPVKSQLEVISTHSVFNKDGRALTEYLLCTQQSARCLHTFFIESSLQPSDKLIINLLYRFKSTETFTVSTLGSGLVFSAIS